MAKRGEGTKAKQKKEDFASASTDTGNVADDEDLKEPRPAQKPRWSGGSWKGKSPATAEVARENISNTPGKPAEQGNNTKPAMETPTKRISERLITPSKTTATTQFSVLSTDDDSSPEKPTQGENQEEKPVVGMDGAERANNEANDGTDEKTAAARGWGSWWSGRAEKGEKATDAKDNVVSQDAEIQPQQEQQKANSATKEDATKMNENIVTKATEFPKGGNIEGENEVNADQAPSSRTSWFGLWGSSGTDPNTASSPKGMIAKPEASNIASHGSSKVEETQMTVDEGVQDHKAPAQRSWAFWSREAPKSDETMQQGKTSKADVGELAVEDTQSESRPQPAESSELQQQQDQEPSSSNKNIKTKAKPTKKTAKDTLVEGTVTRTSEQPDDQTSIDQGPRSNAASGDESSQTGVEAASSDSARSLRKKVQSLQRQNLLLPSLHNTFHVSETPSYWQQFFRLFGRRSSTVKKHLSIEPSTLKPRKALAIGVHGYFPSPWIARVLGQPTGTSLRFANGAAAAIQKWAESKGHTCEIEKVALEGEGMIDHRVNSLWKLLLNWMDQIRTADFIMIACHSQGVPVAMILLAKLISFGCLNSQVRLGVCAMAGVSLGPFPSYQSRILDRPASELFEFSRSQSRVSQEYMNALSTCLTNHVRIVYIGSIDDQIVSLESSLCVTVSHPYIYRAVFVDGRIHAPGFLTSLVGLACKLRNLGISDHGLIRELSAPLAGSLYTGEGHSRIYDDPAVYGLAVEHAIETSDLGTEVPLDIREYEIPSTANANPYFLPWAMRGVLEEEFVRTELATETEELLKRFETWNPTSKVLKDVKFRLDAVRSKL